MAFTSALSSVEFDFTRLQIDSTEKEITIKRFCSSRMIFGSQPLSFGPSYYELARKILKTIFGNV